MVALLPLPVMPSRVWKRSPPPDALRQLGDRGRLVPGRREVRDDLELGHQGRWYREPVTIKPGAGCAPSGRRRSAWSHAQPRSISASRAHRSPLLSSTRSASRRRSSRRDLGGDPGPGVVLGEAPLTRPVAAQRRPRACPPRSARPSWNRILVGDVEKGQVEDHDPAGLGSSAATRSAMTLAITGWVSRLSSARASGSLKTAAARAGRLMRPSGRTTSGPKWSTTGLVGEAARLQDLPADGVRVDDRPRRVRPRPRRRSTCRNRYRRSG